MSVNPAPWSSFWKKEPQFLIYLEPQEIFFSRIKTHLGQNVYQLENPKSLHFKETAPADPQQNLVLNLKAFLEKEKIPGNIKNVILVFSPQLHRQLDRWIPAVSPEELTESIAFEIEEATGQSAREFIYGWRVEEKAVEKGIQKMKVRLALLAADIYGKIKTIFINQNKNVRVYLAATSFNQKTVFLKLNELLPLKEPAPAALENPVFVQKILLPVFILLLALMILQKTISNKKPLSPLTETPENSETSQVSSNPENTTAARLSTTETVKGEPVFTYQTQESPTSPVDSTSRLVGLATGGSKLALIQKGPEILLFKPGDKITADYSISEIFPDRLIAVEKNNKTREIFLNEEIK